MFLSPQRQAWDPDAGSAGAYVSDHPSHAELEGLALRTYYSDAPPAFLVPPATCELDEQARVR